VTTELPPIVKSAAVDTALMPIDVRILLIASQLLDDASFQILKLAAITTPLRISRGQASESLRRLASNGYLDIGPKIDGRTNSFRVSPFLNRKRATI
jgi:hypothetical protein